MKSVAPDKNKMDGMSFTLNAPCRAQLYQVRTKFLFSAGYTGDGFLCEDRDECSDGSHNCDVNAACTNTPLGSFTCTCNRGACTCPFQTSTRPRKILVHCHCLTCMQFEHPWVNSKLRPLLFRRAPIARLVPQIPLGHLPLAVRGIQRELCHRAGNWGTARKDFVVYMSEAPVVML